MAYCATLSNPDELNVPLTSEKSEHFWHFQMTPIAARGIESNLGGGGLGIAVTAVKVVFVRLA